MKKSKANIIVRSNGTQVRLLNPAEKGAKAALELKNNMRVTNMGVPKADENGEVKPLTKEQRAWRAGYLDARADSAMAYCAKQGLSSKTKESRKQRWAARKARSGTDKTHF